MKALFLSMVIEKWEQFLTESHKKNWTERKKRSQQQQTALVSPQKVLIV